VTPDQHPRVARHGDSRGLTPRGAAITFGGLLLAVSAGALGAQTSAPGARLAPADPVTIRRIVDSTVTLVARNYVVPDTGRMIADHIRRRLRAGVFDRPMTLLQLADRLTAEMRAVNQDRHLYALVGGGARSSAPPAAAPGQLVRRRVAGGSAGAPGAPPGPAIEAALAQARRSNFDVRRAEILDGNIGYLAVSALTTRGLDEGVRVLDAALAFLDRADALIIDLPRTRGGDVRTSDYLASYFLADATPTLTSYTRATDETNVRVAGPVRGRKRTDVPLFLLVGPGTASGTEDFAYIMKQRGRATLVGGTTAGAGRLTSTFPVSDNFAVSISGGRTFDPKTNSEWERVGISPDVDTDAAGALTTAHAAAVRRLAEAADDPVRRRALEWTREALLARARSPRPTAAQLREFPGRYDLRGVTAAGGQLLYHRDPARPGEALLPVGGDTFAFGPDVRVRFVRSGARVTSMEVLTPEGQIAAFPRVADEQAGR
jgi:hypothetical protein